MFRHDVCGSSHVLMLTFNIWRKQDMLSDWRVCGCSSVHYLMGGWWHHLKTKIRHSLNPNKYLMTSFYKVKDTKVINMFLKIFKVVVECCCDVKNGAVHSGNRGGDVLTFSLSTVDPIFPRMHLDSFFSLVDSCLNRWQELLTANPMTVSLCLLPPYDWPTDADPALLWLDDSEAVCAPWLASWA